MQTWTLDNIARLVGGTVRGDGQYIVEGLATLKSATSTDMSFLANALYRAALSTTHAGAVLIRPVDRKSTRLNSSHT